MYSPFARQNIYSHILKVHFYSRRVIFRYFSRAERDFLDMDKIFCPGQYRCCPRQKQFCPCRRTRHYMLFKSPFLYRKPNFDLHHTTSFAQPTSYVIECSKTFQPQNFSKSDKICRMLHDIENHTHHTRKLDASQQLVIQGSMI